MLQLVYEEFIIMPQGEVCDYRLGQKVSLFAVAITLSILPTKYIVVVVAYFRVVRGSGQQPTTCAKIYESRKLHLWDR